MTSRSSSNEVLLNNHVDENVQKMFYSFNLAEKLFFSSRYNISDNFITPNSLKFSIATFCRLLIIIALYIYEIIMTKSEGNIGSGTSKLFYLINLYAMYFYCCGYLLIFIQNVVYGNSNVSLVLIIQSVYKSINFDKKKLITFIVRSWIYFLTILSISSAIFLYCYITLSTYNIINLITSFTVLTFDMNMIYGIRVMVLIRELLVSWIEKIKVDNRQAKNWDHIFEEYKNILEAYTLFKKLYQAIILFHAVDTFFGTLGFVETALEVSRLWRQELVDDNIPLMQLLTLIWVTKNLSLQIIQSLECGIFYRYIEEVDNACIMCLNNGIYSETERRVCKNILRLKKASFGKMTACGMFTVGIEFPISMMALLTNYTIVLLQFAFL